MKISQEYAILIKKSLSVKGIWCLLLLLCYYYVFVLWRNKCDDNDDDDEESLIGRCGRLCTEHDTRHLYMLFEYVGGGELFTYLRNSGRFDTATATFYAAEITLVLDYLHSLAIVYRDLKPENLLLDQEGHLKICDFGFAKELKDRCVRCAIQRIEIFHVRSKTDGQPA